MTFPTALGPICLLALLSGLFWSEQDAVGMGSILAEEHEISSGDFRGFAIGSTKQVAAQNLMKLGARDLMAIPLPADLAVSTREPAEITGIVNSKNGIRITDLQGLDVLLFFEGNHVVGVENRSTVISGQLFKTTQTRDLVNDQLRTLLRENPRIQIESIGRIDSAYWGEVNSNIENAVNILVRYDGWHFIVPTERPGGATYRLFFKNERLIRLRYERPRFEK